MKITVFNAGETREAQPGELGDLLAVETNMIWVDMIGPDDDDVRVMSDIFHFHPLAIEDTHNFKQRPKIDEYPGYLFLIVNAVTNLASDNHLPDDRDGKTLLDLDFHEIDIFVGHNYVVTVHMMAESAIEEAYRRTDVKRVVVPVTPNYLLYVLLDAIVDDYFPIMDMLEEEIDYLQDKVLDTPNQTTLNQVIQLKAMLVDMWRVVWPHRDVLSRLLQPHILGKDGKDTTTQFYVRDVSDHLLWIADMIATYRDTLATVIDLYMSAVSNRLNRVVNRLTVLTLGFGMLAVITGFYGMNFEHTWPPFSQPLGVPFVLLLMGIVIVIIVYVLRRLD